MCDNVVAVPAVAAEGTCIDGMADDDDPDILNLNDDGFGRIADEAQIKRPNEGGKDPLEQLIRRDK